MPSRGIWLGHPLSMLARGQLLCPGLWRCFCLVVCSVLLSLQTKLWGPGGPGPTGKVPGSHKAGVTELPASCLALCWLNGFTPDANTVDGRNQGETLFCSHTENEQRSGVTTWQLESKYIWSFIFILLTKLQAHPENQLAQKQMINSAKSNRHSEDLWTL